MLPASLLHATCHPPPATCVLATCFLAACYLLPAAWSLLSAVCSLGVWPICARLYRCAPAACHLLYAVCSLGVWSICVRLSRCAPLNRNIPSITLNTPSNFSRSPCTHIIKHDGKRTPYTIEQAYRITVALCTCHASNTMAIAHHTRLNTHIIMFQSVSLNVVVK